MGEVKVLGAFLSFFCCRVEWALKLKGVAYEYLEEDLRNKSPMLLQYFFLINKKEEYISPPCFSSIILFTGRSRCLYTIGRPIAESLVILVYIDETRKGYPLLLEDPSERALMRFRARFTDEKCVLSAWAAGCAKGHEQEKAIESAQESLNFLEKQIEGKFFGGETMGLLDLVVGSLPNWIEFLEEHGGMKLLDEEKFPSLYEWAQKFISIPIISERIPTKEGLINYSQGRAKQQTYHRKMIYDSTWSEST